jgi:peptidoglycan-associated lipoprotein
MIKKSMIGLLILMFVTSSLLFIVSCRPKPEPKVEDTSQRDAEAAKDKAAADAAAKAKAEADARARADAAAKARAEAKAKERAKMAAMMAVESEKIYFDYDRSELKPESRTILTKKAEWLNANTDYNLRIGGHCDERGSTEYNLALGERRADAASKFLQALGVSGDRITTISYGEQMPVDPGHNERAWAKNRRDEFKLER